ncbi:hypothetical protein BU26DRAFT_220425 [Trematosphaeria pertusa]|uniref:Uncharacterized protein n=1 Tax=Trematosphaeria pertusa TaxID=390896 RepID=A0A6A6IUM7_9PLEO|nr:uncharacterized protein BU26DRAFT_220425 [Trematosphaeria pertusa]KAF2253310.1 hypothetical protein BU26DRAFT_220425 [Trematosphaeria pertusa]
MPEYIVLIPTATLGPIREGIPLNAGNGTGSSTDCNGLFTQASSSGAAANTTRNNNDPTGIPMRNLQPIAGAPWYNCVHGSFNSHHKRRGFFRCSDVGMHLLHHLRRPEHQKHLISGLIFHHPRSLLDLATSPAIASSASLTHRIHLR